MFETNIKETNYCHSKSNCLITQITPYENIDGNAKKYLQLLLRMLPHTKKIYNNNLFTTNKTEAN